MGNQNNKSNKNKIKEKTAKNKNKYNPQNIIIKSQIFKSIQIISKEFCLYFEIYQLKSKNDSIYIACLNYLPESKSY